MRCRTLISAVCAESWKVWARERAGTTHAPSPDVRLVRDMWVRRGGRARVHAVKFMWGLFACGDLLHRRFGRGDGRCDECPGEAETAWHVIGECGAGGAREMRHKWAERMWAEVSAELTHAFSPLDVRVANAVRRRCPNRRSLSLSEVFPHCTHSAQCGAKHNRHCFC